MSFYTDKHAAGLLMKKIIESLKDKKEPIKISTLTLEITTIHPVSIRFVQERLDLMAKADEQMILNKVEDIIEWQ